MSGWDEARSGVRWGSCGGHRSGSGSTLSPNRHPPVTQRRVYSARVSAAVGAAARPGRDERRERGSSVVRAPGAPASKPLLPVARRGATGEGDGGSLVAWQVPSSVSPYKRPCCSRHPAKEACGDVTGNASRGVPRCGGAGERSRAPVRLDPGCKLSGRIGGCGGPLRSDASPCLPSSGRTAGGGRVRWPSPL